MRHPQLEEIVRRFQAGLHAVYGDRLAQLVLYGSQARGDAREYSDINLLVVLRGEVDANAEFKRNLNLTADLTAEYGTLLSPHFVSAAAYETGNYSDRSAIEPVAVPLTPGWPDRLPPVMAGPQRHPQLDAILREYRAALEALYGERLVDVILYGSQARGDAREFSDIDILVVLKGAVDVWHERNRTGDIDAALSRQYDTIINTMVSSTDDYHHKDDSFLCNVREEGVLI